MKTPSVDFQRLFPTLREHRLNGYMALDIMTNNGIEEAMLLFREGEIIAAEYRYLAREQSMKGEDALKLAMRACMGVGTFDIYELGEDEVIGAREDNRDAVLKYKPTDKELLALLPESFQDISLEEKRAATIKAEALQSRGGVSREEVLRKYGISHPDERMVDVLLNNMTN
jgi:hypothetical protein